MKKIILEKLNEIEKAENVKIIHAVESGSRAWGFASPDSDYDVRFIYVRNLEYYLKLEKTRDVIEWQLDESLDINGWDIQKALRLLHNSLTNFADNELIEFFRWQAFQVMSDFSREYGGFTPSLVRNCRICGTFYCRSCNS